MGQIEILIRQMRVAGIAGNDIDVVEPATADLGFGVGAVAILALQPGDVAGRANPLRHFVENPERAASQIQRAFPGLQVYRLQHLARFRAIEFGLLDEPLRLLGTFPKKVGTLTCVLRRLSVL